MPNVFKLSFTLATATALNMVNMPTWPIFLLTFGRINRLKEMFHTLIQYYLIQRPETPKELCFVRVEHQ